MPLKVKTSPTLEQFAR